MSERLRQEIQEQMYGFPYHYLIEFEPDGYGAFRQCKNNSVGWRYASYLIRTIEQVGQHEFQSLVDIGCGDGFFLKKLSEKYPSKELAGLDLSERAIGFAKLLNQGDDGTKQNLEFLSCDITKEHLGQKFDLATCIHVLEHIRPESLSEFIAAVRELINDGGKFIVLVPSTKGPLEKTKRHYQHFDEQSITRVLSEHFKVKIVEHLNNDGFWVKIISRIFTNRLFILNNSSLREWLFKLYMRRFLRCSRPNGRTLLAVCEKQ